jgi:two-component sensor histidine kinase
MSGRAIEAQAQRHRRWDRHADVLVREAYHRISNHLQLLVSLIGMRARELDDPRMADELMQIRRRVLAVARLHAELQRGHDDQMLEISSFLGRVGEDLRLSFGADPHTALHIDFEIDQGEMESDTAITLALIVNELVTNAVKYAVAPDQGHILVRLKHQLDGGWRLLVSDDGPGLPPTALLTAPGHGLDLVRTLVRKLRGSLEIEPSTQGAAISIYFH